MNKCFKEFKLGITPEKKVSLKINTQEKHRQYGLQHNETRKIHYPQEEKFIRMETEVSLGD